MCGPNLWSYCTTTFNPTTAVIFDFADCSGGQDVHEKDLEDDSVHQQRG